jgi:hypothetical protein
VLGVIPVTSHHVRAVLRCATDGVTVGLAEAALDHPARSRARRRLYLAVVGAFAADGLVQELPWVRLALEGATPDAPATEDLDVLVRQGVLACGWGVLVTVVDGPLAPALRRRGVRRPHLVLGVVAGLCTAVSTLPGWWRQAGERAAVEQATARLDEELAELLDQPAG